MAYPSYVTEFARVRCQQSANNTQIARDVKNKFSLDKELDNVRKWVSTLRQREQIQAKQVPIKRLFFDIETGYYILKIRAWQLKNFVKYFNPDDIEREKEIICISYKWDHEDKVHTLDFRIGERQMIKQFIKIMGQADEIVAHNGDKFDIRFLRARALYYGALMFPTYRTLDTLKKSRSSFMFASNRLDYLGKYVGIGGKDDFGGKNKMMVWQEIYENNNTELLEEMIRYCERDVVVLSDYYHIISPFITHNNNFAVLVGGEKWGCPECASSNVVMHHTYTTAMGIIRREMKCNNCKKQYKISNKNYMGMLEYLHKHMNDDK